MNKFLLSIVIIFLYVLPVLTQERIKDREADGLKGRVKSVVSEEARLEPQAGRLTESERMRSPEGEVTYDINGNRVGEKFYDGHGNLIDVIRYDFIGTDKVAIYEDSGNKNLLIAEVPGSSGKASGILDSRYTYKYKYKYDTDGKRSEEIMYNNDGSLWMREVYKRTGNQVEVLVYGEDGELVDKRVSIIDDKGNEIETHFYDTDTKAVESIEAYTYEFDANGNWIKQITSEVVKKKGKTYKQPSKVTYRIITYYKSV